jgi:integral membrane protein
MKNNHSILMQQTNTESFIRQFRVIGNLEGLSFLLLLGVAMPLKYLAGIPEPVKFLGWAHGLLFILYLLYVAGAKWKLGWTFSQLFLAAAASVVPFGPFVVDRKLLPKKTDSLKS